MAFLTSYPSLNSRIIVNGAPEGLDVFAIADLLNLSPEKPLLHIARDEARISEIANMLQFVLPEVEILTFPAWDCLPYDRVSPQADIITQRMNTLEKLASPSWTAKKSCIITSVTSLLQRIPPRTITANLSLNFKTGDILELTHFKKFLSTNGYVRIDTVREAGEYSIRGGIIDIYPGGEEFPLRLDLFGDVIESIKVFDPLSQRTIDSVTDFKLQSMGEIILTPQVIDHFRRHYRHTFGAGSISDPIYEAIINGTKHKGMEHW
ncbi:MAG: transcription-repair coupling factor, partial [Alphaproteobacteria bacterium]|nr:transcription-repair coupling factor [Alphaproteobacteria bacterium]